MPITEEDVIRENWPLVTKACAASKAYLDPEDKLAVASQGLFHAVRTWDVSKGPFPEYAKECILAHIRTEEQRQRDIRRVETSLSLDRPVNLQDGAEGGVMADLLSEDTADTTSTDVSLFLGTLSPFERTVADLLSQGNSLYAVCRLLGADRRNIEQVVKRLRMKAADFFYAKNTRRYCT